MGTCHPFCFVKWGLLLCLLISWGPSSLFAQAEAKQPMPNIILLMGDDHGWEEVGYNGHPYVKTPYLDEMAAAGLRLDNFYAQPSCSPTRGSVLTGRHPNRYGIFTPGYSIRMSETESSNPGCRRTFTTIHTAKLSINLETYIFNSDDIKDQVLMKSDGSAAYNFALRALFLFA